MSRRVSRHGLRRPFWTVALLLFVTLGIDYLDEVQRLRPAMSWMGLPQSQESVFSWARVLRNDGFLVGWSDLRGNALWVTYKLMPPPPGKQRLPRPDRFTSDWRAFGLIDHDSFTRSGYNRGHLAPSHTIGRLYGRAAQQATFRMTNISPQRSELNQRVWQRLEHFEIDELTARYGEVWVMTGPVFTGERERLSTHLLVEIPDAFYKIFAVKEADGSPRLFAFIVPQTVRGDEPLQRFVTRVDEVEALTRLDFFPALEDTLEKKLEAGSNPPPNLPPHARGARNAVK